MFNTLSFLKQIYIMKLKYVSMQKSVAKIKLVKYIHPLS